MAASEQHWDDVDDEAQDPTRGQRGNPAGDEDEPKDDVVEYFGADGEDEGQKLMQNADGTWGEAQNPAG